MYFPIVWKISKISIFCFSGFGFFRSKKQIQNAGLIGAVFKQDTIFRQNKNRTNYKTKFSLFSISYKESVRFLAKRHLLDNSMYSRTQVSILVTTS